MPMSALTTLLTRRLRGIALAVTVVVLAACGQATDGEPGSSPTTEPAPPDETASPTPDDDSGDEPDDTGDDTDNDADDADDADNADDADDGDVDAMAFTDCEAERYTVGYPSEWDTNAGDGLLGPCEIFHPGDIEEPERPRDMDLHYAAAMYVDDVDFDERDSSDNPNEVIDERETTVDGRRARVVEYHATGEGLTPKGEYSYTWTVDLDGEILVATTSTVGGTDYQRDKQVLDRIVTEELTIHDETEMVDGPSTTERSTQEPDGSVVLTDVSVGAHDSFDRIVLEVIGDGEAGWLVEYDEDPRSQGRGDPVDVEGDAVLRVALRHLPYPVDAPEESYDGPERIEPERTDAVVEVVQDVLWEGYQDFFIGLDEERPYRVERLDDPQRIVIDIETD